ncbi:branched-chain amino acid transport system substrate-binding protein [Rhodopseudomonas thermotolerans]|uniref:Branched-chain amino acid transport system substrate-binding protein n=2 Tax=Rhodopseudomonas TaxID=1073 RepID=A0A336JUQ9_9BRAD|nr:MULTISPECIES: ABC transporter substrate-binding protein [Rhodopseudomonas]RED29071.1 branched-chain amino acid transport system substrate-binding protein [Rhodopseudomonas pentothenatexigens]REF92308.1 branched-chain amino acid transport system substrate-binding protein [Rhodopseudomonas thermotolerans]SSW92483.1 branched-chain amino acid transport system substrate-binding protein [Rhodopseudomonas pentothenatexigens]
MRLVRPAAILIAALLAAAPAGAETETAAVKVGVLTDMSGILASGLGPGSVDGARMAIEDFGGTLFGKPIELVFADHQNKPDIGSTLARRWLDEGGVDVIADVGNSAVALAVRELVQSKDRLALFVGASSSALTAASCSPNTVQWSHDSYMFVKAVPTRLLAEGKKKWFLIIQDWAFGHAMQADITRVIADGGGEIVGSVRHPPGTMDFSSILLQAQGSGADVIAFLSAIQDLSTSIKQAHEYNLGKDGKQTLFAPAFLLPDARGLGPEAGQGIIFSTVWYWNLNPEARAWSQRFFARNKVMPAEAHAGTYSAVLHYLKAVQAAGTKKADVVMAKMREMPVKDFYTDNAKLRADGRLMRAAYVARMKTPAESKEPWDYYQILSEIPAEQAFRPASEKACPLLK